MKNDGMMRRTMTEESMENCMRMMCWMSNSDRVHVMLEKRVYQNVLFCKNVKPVTSCLKIESAAAKGKTFSLRFSEFNRPLFWSLFKLVVKQL